MNKEFYVAHLKQYKVADLRMYLEIICNTLLGDMDFSLALHEDELPEIIEKELPQTKGKMDALFSKETLDLYRRLQDYCFSEENLKKVETRELLAEALADEAVSEALWLCLAARDDEADEFAEELGATADLERLRADETFRMRKSYLEMIRSYAEAAANLYGTISIAELETLIHYYHASFENPEKYQRADGAYRQTIFLSPEYLNVLTLQYTVGNAVPLVQQSLDGMVMNRCFVDAYREEINEFTVYMKELSDSGKAIGDSTLADFLETRTYPYRRLQDKAMMNLMYLPSETEFLRYANEMDMTVWETEEEEQFRKLLEAEDDLPEAEARVLMTELREKLWDHNVNAVDWEKEAAIQSALVVLEKNGIKVSTSDERQKLEDALTIVTDHLRMWTYRGNTAAELRSATSMKGAGISVISEKQETITKPKKVYPNDPCPCGSGKKYKKCCGRK